MVTFCFFTGTNTGYVVGGYGTILKTINAGNDWTTHLKGTNNLLFSVFFTDANTGYAVGDYGTILKTTTGGVVSIEESIIIQSDEIKIYPNPANSVLNVETGVVSKSALCRVYDISGTEVIVKTFTGNKTQTDISRLAKGLYLLRTENENGISTKRFIKE